MKTNDFRYAKRFAIFFVIVAALTVAASSAAVFAGANDQYYGREALASLPNGANYQGAYDAICQGVANKEQSISIDEFALSPFEMHGVYCTVAADHPELYFWNSSLINYSAADSVVYDVFPLYYDGLDDDAFISGAEAILASVYDTSSEYVISLALHDALVEHIIYSSSAPHAGSAYGAIVDGYAKCDGYARAYQYLLSQFGIQSFIVSGEGKGGPHAWNLVNLDGEWYYTDVTWDDPIPDRGNSVYWNKYLLIPQEQMAQDHTVRAYY